MGCEPHDFHRCKLTPENGRLLKSRPRMRTDPSWMQIHREWWDRCIEEDRKKREAR